MLNPSTVSGIFLPPYVKQQKTFVDLSSLPVVDEIFENEEREMDVTNRSPKGKRICIK